ncbi:hypothetical protein [Enterobacter hormaechei]|uniref:hypothetical protein n=1 Tax=Enterobacter hormaechei TaxID=158836 RepID=UPI001C9B9899|nr:hypothetical protein [Enterobacter hormaechei]MBY7198017.1 hypothetical protein [Enterobacter hormaechei]
MESVIKQLVKSGHELAAQLGNQLGMNDTASLVQRLTAQLDITAAALREMTKKRDALAAENAGLKQSTPDLQTMMTALDVFFADDEVPERAMLAAYNVLRNAVPTPATDSFLAEVRAQGVEMLASLAGNECQRYKSVNDRSGARKWKSIVILCTDFAAQIRKGVQS